jgi:macrodomain Ter protein organizer (MatP/YcbG family)
MSEHRFTFMKPKKLTGFKPGELLERESEIKYFTVPLELADRMERELHKACDKIHREYNIRDVKFLVLNRLAYCAFVIRRHTFDFRVEMDWRDEWNGIKIVCNPDQEALVIALPHPEEACRISTLEHDPRQLQIEHLKKELRETEDRLRGYKDRHEYNTAKLVSQEQTIRRLNERLYNAEQEISRKANENAKLKDKFGTWITLVTVIVCIGLVGAFINYFWG